MANQLRNVRIMGQYSPEMGRLGMMCGHAKYKPTGKLSRICGRFRHGSPRWMKQRTRLIVDGLGQAAMGSRVVQDKAALGHR